MVQFIKLFVVAIYIIVAACLTTGFQKLTSSFFARNALLYQIVSLFAANYISLNIFLAYCPKGKSSINVYLQGEHETHHPCLTKIDIARTLMNLFLSVLMAFLSLKLTNEMYLDSFDPMELLLIINILLMSLYLVISPPKKEIIEVKVYDLEANLLSNHSIKVTGSVCQCGCAYYADCYKPNNVI
jgi:hypothetical protein